MIGRPWLHAIALTLVLNTVFVALSILSSILIPRETIVQKVRGAFAIGDLSDQDYLPYNSTRGWHQYNDCNILQMMTNPDPAPLGPGLGPWIHFADHSALDACRTLRELILDGRQHHTLVSQRYTRYWHGYIPLTSALLVGLDISAVRATLRAITYASVLLVLVAGFWERWFLPFTVSVATAGVLFWGLPYFGQGFSHALGDSAVMVGIACLIFWHRRLVKPAALLPFCALFGAVIVYFEMLTGPLPTAAGFLFPVIYLLSRFNRPSSPQTIEHLRLATVAVIAFALGATLTVAARVAVAAALVQPSGIDLFFANLNSYTTSVGAGSSFDNFLRPLLRLLRRGAVLTYGSNWILLALYTSTLVAWVAAIRLVWKVNSAHTGADFAVFVMGAASVLVWCILLPTHTFVHADFMARILIVPISLGWAALLWQLRLRSHDCTTNEI